MLRSYCTCLPGASRVAAEGRRYLTPSIRSNGNRCVASEVASTSNSEALSMDVLVNYHEQTKHSFRKYAKGPHGLDWRNQPNPFRRYAGARTVPLQHIAKFLETDPLYADLWIDGAIVPKELAKETLSQLLYDSLALSAWKSTGVSTWSLRVNPSSGNLHPTEGYVICGPVEGICETPFVAHYAPKEHALEIRTTIDNELWSKLMDGLPRGSFLIGLSSIFWRESWKYGERAFRYCNHDVGHAIGAISIAAGVLGWESVLLDRLSSHDVECLLGLTAKIPVASDIEVAHGRFPQLEQEHGDCVIAIIPRERHFLKSQLFNYLPSASAVSGLSQLTWDGQANILSREHVLWGVIYKASEASKKPQTPPISDQNLVKVPIPASAYNVSVYRPLKARQVIRMRRSAVSMDGKHSMEKAAFYQILLKTLNSIESSVGLQGQLPFTTLPWEPELHMAIFVHRVVGLAQGIYFCIRNPAHETALREAMRPFEWEKPAGCPDILPLYRLVTADCQLLAERLSCHQEIASEGCFSLGMISHFEDSLKRGSWMYPRLFWEAGMLGQVLYLEAHAIGFSATGIGCYFDDAVHEVLGLKSIKFQSLYHFTVGIPIEDKRIMNLPAYPGPKVDA